MKSGIGGLNLRNKIAKAVGILIATGIVGYGVITVGVPKESSTIPTQHYVEVEAERWEYHQEEFESVSNLYENEPRATETTSAIEIPTEEVESLTDENMNDFSDYEIALLERVVMSEASIEPYDCKVAVAETILNRMDMYNCSVEDVVYAPNQYSMADNGQPTDEVKQAVAQALEYRVNPVNMIYFRQDYYHSFGTPYTAYGEMYFSLK